MSPWPPGRTIDPRAAGDQRPEDLQHRDVEADRRLLQQPYAAGQDRCAAWKRRRLAAERWETATPLGTPGRARGVDDVGRVVRAGRPGPGRPASGPSSARRPSSGTTGAPWPANSEAQRSSARITPGLASASMNGEPLGRQRRDRAAGRRRRPRRPPSRPATSSGERSAQTATIPATRDPSASRRARSRRASAPARRSRAPKVSDAPSKTRATRSGVSAARAANSSWRKSPVRVDLARVVPLGVELVPLGLAEQGQRGEAPLRGRRRHPRAAC